MHRLCMSLTAASVLRAGRRAERASLWMCARSRSRILRRTSSLTSCVQDDQGMVTCLPRILAYLKRWRFRFGQINTEVPPLGL